MLGVREQATVAEAVDDACEKWERARDAWDSITWSLARDPTVGAALNEAGTVRSLIFEGARSIKMPTVEVIYVHDRTTVTIVEATFHDSAHHHAGHG